MLKAEHVTKQYQVSGGGHTMFDAVSDVSMELKDGCVTAIVGESGSGKSTFARVLSYVERPDSGRVFLDSLEVTACGRKDLRTVRGKVQLVMQNAVGVALAAEEMAARGETVSARDLVPVYLRLSQAERERLAKGLKITLD